MTALIMPTKKLSNDEIKQWNKQIFRGINQTDTIIPSSITSTYRDNTYTQYPFEHGTIVSEDIPPLNELRRMVLRGGDKRFNAFIERGVGYARFEDALFGKNGEFVLYVMKGVGVKRWAWCLLRHVMTIGVKDESDRSVRIMYVDYIFEKYFSKWQDRVDPYPFEKMSCYSWAVEFIDKFKKLLQSGGVRPKRIDSLIKVAQYCLLLLYKYDEATIAVVNVERKLLMKHASAARCLKQLYNEYPLLLVTEQYNYFQHHATKYMLNADFVNQVLGQSKIALKYESLLDEINE